MGIPAKDLQPHVLALVREQTNPDLAEPKRRSKYGSRRVVADGFRFDSAKEARYYGDLKAMQMGGEIRYFHRQPVFDLPGGTQYFADFLIVHKDGSLEYVDVKSVATKKNAVYRMKKRQVQEIYGVTINER